MYNKIIIAGGGTGGHIFPAIAIAHELKKQRPALEILFIGAKGKMEMEKIPEAGYVIKGLDIAGFNRSHMLKNISLPFKLAKSYLQVKKIFKNFSPDAVIGVGGYSTYPVLRYAQKHKIPTFIHESNSFAGKSNILLGKMAEKIFVSSERMEKFFPAQKIRLTGNPVRKKIVESRVDKLDALAFFGLQPGKKTLLVIGGSLGAKSINTVIAKHIADVKTQDIQVIWQTGKVNADEYVRMGTMAAGNVFVAAFIADMEKAYAAADVVVARAGAMTVTELCVVGKPVIFVPYPYAAEDHQTVNATYLVERNASMLVPDKDVTTMLYPAIMQLLNDKEKQHQLANNIKAMAVTDASEKIAGEILNVVYK